jgi:hypothetical protein
VDREQLSTVRRKACAAAGITGLTFYGLRGSAGARRRDCAPDRGYYRTLIEGRRGGPQLGDEAMAKLETETKTPDRE